MDIEYDDACILYAQDKLKNSLLYISVQALCGNKMLVVKTLDFLPE